MENLGGIYDHQGNTGVIIDPIKYRKKCFEIGIKDLVDEIKLDTKVKKETFLHAWEEKFFKSFEGLGFHLYVPHSKVVQNVFKSLIEYDEIKYDVLIDSNQENNSAITGVCSNTNVFGYLINLDKISIHLRKYFLFNSPFEHCFAYVVFPNEVDKLKNALLMNREYIIARLVTAFEKRPADQLLFSINKVDYLAHSG